MQNLNPPAFPVAEDHKIASDLDWTAGMTLRDYFAGQAIAGIVQSGYGPLIQPLNESAVTAAKEAYIFADAMLTERLK